MDKNVDPSIHYADRDEYLLSHRPLRFVGHELLDDDEYFRVLADIRFTRDRLGYEALCREWGFTPYPHDIDNFGIKDVRGERGRAEREYRAQDAELDRRMAFWDIQEKLIKSCMGRGNN